MPTQKGPVADRRQGDRRVANVAELGFPDRRKGDRRSGEDRRASARTRIG